MHRFRQDSDLLYVCGFPEPDCLAIVTSAHPNHRFVLFVPGKDEKREVWTGPRAGVEGAVRLYGADAAYPYEELKQRLPEYLENVEELTYPLGRDPELDGIVLAAIAQLAIRERDGISRPSRILDPRLTLHEMRLYKEASEIEVVRRAVEATAHGFRAAAGSIRPGAREHEVRAELEAGFLRLRGVPGFPSIVASGIHATTLHYEGDDGELAAGDLLLIDAGAEVDGYTADVTRTFPVSGKFTDAQLQLYKAVLQAEEVAIQAVGPGVTLNEVHTAAVQALTASLVELGLIPEPFEDALAEHRYARFFMHRTSHWLGLDTHDVGSLLRGGKERPLEPGMLLTVEPGLYIPASDDVPMPYRGNGIRIEDDVLVTETGCEVLTAAIPKQPSEVERLVGTPTG